jgi:hypothetical protein
VVQIDLHLRHRGLAMADLGVGGIDLRRRRLHGRERRLIARRRGSSVRLRRRQAGAGGIVGGLGVVALLRRQVAALHQPALAREVVLGVGERRLGALEVGRGGTIAGAQVVGIGARPLELRLRDRDIGAGDGEIGLRIVQARGDGIAIEARENLAGRNGGIVGDQNVAQLAGGLRDHGHGGERPQGSGRVHFGLNESAVDGGDPIERPRLAWTEIGTSAAGEGERHQAERNGTERTTDQGFRTQGLGPLTGGRDTAG